MQGTQVGTTHTTTRREQLDGRDLLRTDSETQLKVQRFGDSSEQSLRYTTWDTTDGKLVRFDSVMRQSEQPLNVSGVVEGEQLVITTTGSGSAQTRSLPWKHSFGGFEAATRSLRERPMQPGERRTLSMLLPFILQVATIELSAVNFESTKLLDQSARLLRVEQTMTLSGAQPIRSTSWLDEHGEILKTEFTALGQSSYRATKERALRKPSTERPLDLGVATTVALKQPMKQGHDANRARYLVTVAGADPSTLFKPSLGQSVKSTGPNSAEIVVQRVRGDTAGPSAVESPAAPADLQSSALIQSDDPLIMELAKSAALDETDPWKTAVRLEAFVRQAVKDKEFTQAFASAAEVARSRRGDCTEHAVLLAALCRARKIPARVVMGLVYVPAAQSFVFHMWTDVHLGGRWVGLDGTLGRGGIDAAYLTVGHSSLEQSDLFASFLSVFQLLGQLKIEVLEEQ